MRTMIVKRSTVEIVMVTVSSIGGCPEAEELMRKAAIEKAQSPNTEWQHSISTYTIESEVAP